MEMFLEYNLNDFIELGQITKGAETANVNIPRSDRGPDVKVWGIDFRNKTNFAILEEAYRIYCERDDTSKNRPQLTH